MGIIAVPPARLHPTLNPPDSVKLNPASWFAQQQTARVWHSNLTVGLTDLSQNQNHAITQGFGIGKQPSQFGSGVYGDVGADPIPALSGYSTPVGSAMLTGASAITMWGVVCFSDLTSPSETALIRAETYGSGADQYAFDLFPSTGVFRPLLTTSGTTGWSTGNDVTVSGLKTGELYLMLTRWQSGQVFETLVQQVGSALAGYLTNTLAPTGTIASNGVVPTNIGGMGYTGVGILTFPGWIYLAGVVGEYMPDGVVAELLADPFNYVLKPTNDLLPVHLSGGSGVALAGDSPQEQRATGTVSLSVPVAGISIQKAVGKGIANIGIPLAGDATVRQNTAGDLLISVPLDGNAIQRQLDSGTLSMATSISGQTKQSQSVLGALSISVTMAGDVIQRAYANGTLTNTAAGAISLTGYSLQTQIAHGLASIGVALSGHSLSVQSGDGKPTTLVPLSGVVAQAQLVSGGLGVKVDLLGHMLQKAISNASLSVSGGGGVSLSGHSTQHQSAESTMILQVVLSGKSVQESIAQGYLSGAGKLSIDPRYLITGLGRNFDITARRSLAL